MYSSPTYHKAEVRLRNTYHPLFDYYGVDLVQRLYPLEFNLPISSTLIVADKNPDTYINPNGTIFIIVGTGGAKQYNITGHAPFISKQFERYDFLNNQYPK